MLNFVESQKIANVWLNSCPVYSDSRGFFVETFRENILIPRGFEFIQDGTSFSKKNVLRGMHLQMGQSQLITLIQGEIIDLIFDLNVDSETYLIAEVNILSSKGVNQILTGPNIAHGFCVLSDTVLINYKSDKYYQNSNQLGFNWKSPEILNLWTDDEWIVSDRDTELPLLSEFILQI